MLDKGIGMTAARTNDENEWNIIDTLDTENSDNEQWDTVSNADIDPANTTNQPAVITPLDNGFFHNIPSDLLSLLFDYQVEACQLFLTNLSNYEEENAKPKNYIGYTYVVDPESKEENPKLYYTEQPDSTPTLLKLKPELLQQFHDQLKPTSKQRTLTTEELRRIRFITLHQASPTHTTYNRTLTFFNNMKYGLWKKAADDILWGSSDTSHCLKLVTEDPSLLEGEFETVNPRGIKVKGTLLQIAAMAGDFNVDENTTGLVEQFKIIGNLSEEEVTKQLEVLTSKEAKEKNELRKQRTLRAMTLCSENILAKAQEYAFERLCILPADTQQLEKNTLYFERTKNNTLQFTFITPGNQRITKVIDEKAPTPFTEYALNDSKILLIFACNKAVENEIKEEFLKQCQPIIDQLEQKLTPDAKEIITSGYIFDLDILNAAGEWFEKNMRRFKDINRYNAWISYWSSLSNLWWTQVFGKLVSYLSARDAHFINAGIGHWNESGTLPPRTLVNYDEEIYFFNSSSPLGRGIFLGYYGIPCKTAVESGTDLERTPDGILKAISFACAVIKCPAIWAKKLVAAKKKGLQQLVQAGNSAKVKLAP